MSGYSGGGSSTFTGGAVTTPITFPDGTVGAPAVTFTSDTTTGWYKSGAGAVRLSITNTDIIAATTSFVAIAAGTTKIGSSSVFGWTSGAGPIAGSLDTGLARSAAGVVEIDNGTPGTIQDLKLRRLLVGGTAPTSATSTGLGTGSAALDAGSTDSCGTITLSPTGSPAALGTITLTFSAALGGNNGPAYAFMLLNGTGTWNTRASCIGATQSTTAPTINWDNNAVALTAGSTYKVMYVAIGK